MSVIKIETFKRPVIIEVNSSVPTVITAQFGTPGPAGPAGPDQFYYQSAQPSYTGKFLWFETDSSGDVINLWINDGTP